MLIVVFPDKFLRFGSGRLDSLFSLLGMALMLSGMLLRVSSRGYKSEHSSGGMFLVRGGPYALVRNPMYLGILLIGSGVIFLCFKWWMLLIFLLVLVRRYLTLIFQEEKILLSGFPQEYADYREKTPRLFPRLAGLIGKDVRQCLPLKPAWFKKEASSIFATVTAAVVLKLWAASRSGRAIVFIPQLAGLAAMIIFFVILAGVFSKKNEDAAA